MTDDVWRRTARLGAVAGLVLVPVIASATLLDIMVASPTLLAWILSGTSACVVVWSTRRTRRDLVAGRPPSLILLLGSALVYFGVGLSALVTISNPAQDKLVRLNATGSDVLGTLHHALIVVEACLAVTTLALSTPRLCGRVRVGSGMVPLAQRSDCDTEHWMVQRRTHTILSIFAICGASYTQVQRYDFAARGGVSGGGLASLLYWCIAISICVGILSNHWGSKARLSLSFALLADLVLTGDRSPLLLVGCALFVQMLRKLRTSGLLVASALTPGLIFVMLAMSAWRGERISNGSTSWAGAFAAVIRSPAAAFATGGFDTLPGLQFCLQLSANGVHAPWWTPLMALGNFVPRQLWPSKPGIFGTTITHQFLGLSKGGIFLSGPGYLTLLTGSATGAVVLLALFTRAAQSIALRYSSDLVIWVVLLYGSIRFVMGGDPFDVFLILQIILSYKAARYLSIFFRRLQRSYTRTALAAPRRAANMYDQLDDT